MKSTTLAALGLATGLAMPAAAEEIKVGLMLPLSGVYAALGNDIEAGFTLGLETYGDRTEASFAIIREDTEASPPVALGKARKLILQGCASWAITRTGPATCISSSPRTDIAR